MKARTAVVSGGTYVDCPKDGLGTPVPGISVFLLAGRKTSDPDQGSGASDVTDTFGQYQIVKDNTASRIQYIVSRATTAYSVSSVKVTLQDDGSRLKAKADRLCLLKKDDVPALTTADFKTAARSMARGYLLLQNHDLVTDSELESAAEQYRQLAMALPKDSRDERTLRDLGSDLAHDLRQVAQELDFDVPSVFSEERLWSYGHDIQSTQFSSGLRQYEYHEWIPEHGRFPKFGQSPLLDQLVATGRLPPVSERLPNDPVVVEPQEGIGRYGGTLHEVHPLGSHSSAVPWVAEYPLTYSHGHFNLSPNVLSGWEWNDDGKSLTLYTREGLKWSDGEPFSADDLLFHWNDIVLNKELFASTPRGIVSGGTAGVMNKISSTEVRISWDKSAFGFLEVLAGGLLPHYAQMRYLMQVHPAHTSMESIEASMKERGFESWTDQFNTLYNTAVNSAAPVLGPWQRKDSELDQGVRFVRNPYYWKVDTEGNQLPYIDSVLSTEVPRGEHELMRILTGQMHLQRLSDGSRSVGVQIVEELLEKSEFRVLSYWFPEDKDKFVFADEQTWDVDDRLIANVRLRNVPDPILPGFVHEVPAQFYLD